MCIIDNNLEACGALFGIGNRPVYPSLHLSIFSKFLVLSSCSGPFINPPYPANDGFTSIVFVVISLRPLVSAKQAELGTPHRHHHHHHRSFTTFAPMALSRGNQNLDGISDKYLPTHHDTFKPIVMKLRTFSWLSISKYDLLV